MHYLIFSLQKPSYSRTVDTETQRGSGCTSVWGTCGDRGARGRRPAWVPLAEEGTCLETSAGLGEVGGVLQVARNCLFLSGVLGLHRRLHWRQRL